MRATKTHRSQVDRILDDIREDGGMSHGDLIEHMNVKSTPTRGTPVDRILESIRYDGSGSPSSIERLDDARARRLQRIRNGSKGDYPA